MSRLARMQTALARAFSDPEWQERLFASEVDRSDELGLLPDELRTIQAIDRRAFRIASEGFAGKRFEAISHVHDWTLTALGLVWPAARADYLGKTRPAPTEREEALTFRRYVESGVELGSDARRLLLDLLDLECYVESRAPALLAAWRFDPDALRPARACEPLASRGSIVRAVEALGKGKLPVRYPEEPGLWLAADRARLERLGEAERAAWERCDGTWTVAEIVSAGVVSESTLARWLEMGFIRA